MKAAEDTRQLQAVAALRSSDPVLGHLIDAYGPIDLWAWRGRWPREPFALLARSIVGQQISTRAAQAIFERLRALLDADFSARGVAARSDEELLSVGLSRAKLASLRDLSDHVLSGELQLDRLTQLTDEVIRGQLTAVRGIGTWTSELFLLALGREDALPSADVGLRRAVRAAYGLDHLPGTVEVEQLGERWRPHRSFAALYLYASLRQPAPE